MSFGLCEGRGVLAVSPNWVRGSFPTHLSALGTRQSTLQLPSRETLKPVFDIIAHITCSKGRRHASRTSLTMDLEQAALPLPFEDYLLCIGGVDVPTA